MTPTERHNWRMALIGRGHRPGWTKFRRTYRTYKVPGESKYGSPKFMGRITRVGSKRDRWKAEVWETAPPTRGMTWVAKGYGTHDEMVALIESFAVEVVLEREPLGP